MTAIVRIAPQSGLFIFCVRRLDAEDQRNIAKICQILFFG